MIRVSRPARWRAVVGRLPDRHGRCNALRGVVVPLLLTRPAMRVRPAAALLVAAPFALAFLALVDTAAAEPRPAAAAEREAPPATLDEARARLKDLRRTIRAVQDRDPARAEELEAELARANEEMKDRFPMRSPGAFAGGMAMTIGGFATTLVGSVVLYAASFEIMCFEFCGPEPEEVQLAASLMIGGAVVGSAGIPIMVFGRSRHQTPDEAAPAPAASVRLGAGRIGVEATF